VRIKNADGSVGAVLLSLTFIVPAVAVLVRPAVVLRPLVAWTVVVWLLRIGDIVVASDHGVAFKVVHTMLGAVSIALGIAAVKAAGRPRRASGSGSRLRPSGTR
jgi:TctA family transporter